MLKRISAATFDMILLVCLVLVLAAALSAVLGYASYNESMQQSYDAYGQAYGVDVSISWAEYEQLPQETKDRYDMALEAINADDAVLRTYTMMVNLTLIIASVSILAGYLVLELLIWHCSDAQRRCEGDSLHDVCPYGAGQIHAGNHDPCADHHHAPVPNGGADGHNCYRAYPAVAGYFTHSHSNQFCTA